MRSSAPPDAKIAKLETLTKKDQQTRASGWYKRAEAGEHVSAASIPASSVVGDLESHNGDFGDGD